MTNIQDRLAMDHNSDDDINQSVEGEELPRNAAEQNSYQPLDQLMGVDNTPLDVGFGQTEPVPAGEQIVVNNRYRIKKITCLGVVALLLLLIFLSSIHLSLNTLSLNLSNTSDNDNLRLIIKEKNECDSSDTIPDDKQCINADNEILALMEYDEPNVQDIFKEIVVKEDIDNTTCGLYGIFLYVCSKLCSLKDDIIGIIPKKPPDDIESFEHVNKKSGQTSPSTTDNDSVLKIEENGAHRTDVSIPKQTSAINQSNELVVKNSV